MIGPERRWVLLAVLALLEAALAQRISLLDFTGPTGRQVRAQLVGKVCDTADCVAANKVVTAGKPDGKKAKRELLQYVVQGTVTRARGRTPGALELSVLTVDRGTLSLKTRRAFGLDLKGLLPAKTVPGVVEYLKASLQEPQPVEPVRPAPPPPQATRPPEPAPQPVPVAPPPERAPEPVAEPAPAAEARPQGARPPFLAIELGADLLNRNLDYVGVTTGNVRTYNLPFFPVPQVRLEVYPLAFGGPGLLSGLGLEGAFAYAPYLKSKRVGSDTDAYPTTVMKVDAAVRWRIVPFSSYALAIIPFVGWRLQSFTVGPLAAGGRLDGLPDITFNGLRAGLAVEVPVVPRWVTIIAHGGVLPMFSSGEIISATFFKGGSTFGFEAGGGVAVQLLPWLQVRGTFEYTRYTLTFQTTAGDAYVATSASDTYLGGNAALRLQF